MGILSPDDTGEVDSKEYDPDPTLEDRVRSEHATTRQLLQELRQQRKEIDATVRELVAADKTQKRLIAVFDRAKAKQNA